MNQWLAELICVGFVCCVTTEDTTLSDQRSFHRASIEPLSLSTTLNTSHRPCNLNSCHHERCSPSPGIVPISLHLSPLSQALPFPPSCIGHASHPPRCTRPHPHPPLLRF